MVNKNDKQELIKLIQQNPDLPLVFFVNNDEICGDYGSTVMEDFYVYKSEVFKYERFGDLCFSDDEDEVVEYYCDHFVDEEKYADLSQEEYEEVIKNYIRQNIQHYEAIVINVC